MNEKVSLLDQILETINTMDVYPAKQQQQQEGQGKQYFEQVQQVMHQMMQMPLSIPLGYSGDLQVKPDSSRSSLEESPRSGSLHRYRAVHAEGTMNPRESRRRSSRTSSSRSDYFGSGSMGCCRSTPRLSVDNKNLTKSDKNRAYCASWRLRRKKEDASLRSELEALRQEHEILVKQLNAVQTENLELKKAVHCNNRHYLSRI